MAAAGGLGGEVVADAALPQLPKSHRAVFPAFPHQGAKPAVEVASVEPGAKTLKVTLKNAGNKYANLALSNVELSGGTFKSVVKDEAWRRALGTSWILPGGTRVVELPKPDKAPAELNAKFNLVEATP